MLTAAEALEELGLPAAPLRVERWLVGRGADLELGRPVLEATLLDGTGRPVTLLAQHAAVLERRFPTPGTVVAPGSALLTVTGVRAFLALPQRLTEEETGVLLCLPPRPAHLDGRPEADVVTATVAGVPTTARWGSRVVVLLPPGTHRVVVTGSPDTEVTVRPGRLTAVVP